MAVAPTPMDRTPFVGRVDELNTIHEVVASAWGEFAVRAVFVFGPPGAGKSRLLDEAVARLEYGRLLAVVGYAHEAEVAYASASDLIAVAAGAVPEGDALQLFEAVNRGLARRGRLLVTVEDLPWVDPASRALLHYVLRGARAQRQAMALVVTSREEAGARAFSAATRDVLGPHDHVEVELGPLTLSEGRALAVAVRPEVTQKEAVAAYEHSEGWPFWLELSCRAPGDRAESLGRWLLEVGPDAASLLRLLAVAGRPLSGDALARIQGWPRLRVLAALDETHRRGLTVAVGSDSRITHDLLGAQIVRRADREETAQLHRRIAAHYESVADDDVRVLLRAVEHRLAGGAASVELVRRILRAPARRRITADGVERLWDVVNAADMEPTEAPTVLSGLAALTDEIGEPSDALARWVAVAGQLPEGRARALAWLAASRAAATLEDAQSAYGFLDRARVVPSPDEPLCVHQDAQEASVRFLERRLDEGVVVAARALQRARTLASASHGRRAGGEATRAAHLRALAAAGEAARLTGDPDAMVEVGQEMAEVAGTQDEVASLEGLRLAGFGLFMLGHAAEADAHLRAAWDRARAQVLPTAILDSGFWFTLGLHTWGRLRESRDVVDECLDLGRRVGGWSRSVENIHVASLLLELCQGDWRAAVATLGDHADTERDSHARIRVSYWLVSSLARLAPETSTEEVRRRLEQAAHDAQKAGCRRCADELSVRGVDALARCGAVGLAREWSSRFDPDRMPRDVYLRWWHRRSLATLACATGTPHARQRLEQVAQDARELGMEIAAVWVRLDLAELDDDQSDATAVLEDARRRAHDLGATTEERLAERRLRSQGVRAWRRTAASEATGPLAGLTEREQEVAQLVAEGASNPEIAERLFVTRKTVESHVSHIFTKLGLRNRIELAALLHDRHGTT